MSPEERHLLTDLFDRVRGAAGTPRDREAEDLIAQRLREQPYAAYFLAQAVIVQDQALQATTSRIHQLEDQLQRLPADTGAPRNANTGFLGSLGSLFGGNQQTQDTQQSRDTQQSPGNDQQREGRLYDDCARSNRQYEPEPQPQAPSPWGRAGATGPWSQPAMSSSSGGFLRGALGTAAGVAGGVLVADAVRDLFSSHWGGTGANATGLAGFGSAPVEETVVNNYFLDDDKSDDDSRRADDNDNDNDNDDFDSGDLGDDDSYV
jgi:hypothetical protein